MMQINSFVGEYEFLSNFYRSPFFMEGHVFPTVEHYFQACKTLDASEFKHVVNQRTPGQAKRAGQKVKLRDDWEAIKVRIMFQAVLAKFNQNGDLRKRLIAIRGKLVEGNSWGDTYWGVCGGQGQNKLGIILSDVRSILGSRNG